MNTDEKDWQSLYEDGDTGWDLGSISPPLKKFIDQLEDKSLNILIPGGGNSYEAEYLFKKGFENVHVVDIALTPLQSLRARVPNFPYNQLHHRNFFDMVGTFDLIIEQTFLCALPPKLRPDYAKKTEQLLEPQGRLVGLLFDFALTEQGPPFGGDEQSYRALFSPLFDIVTMDRCYNSIDRREGEELFIDFRKRTK